MSGEKSKSKSKSPIFRDLNGVNHYDLNEMEPELSVLLDDIHDKWVANPDEPTIWPRRFVYLVNCIVSALMRTNSFRNYTVGWKDEMVYASLIKIYKHAKKYDKARLSSDRPACTFLTFIIGQAIRNSITALKQKHIRQMAVDSADWTVLGDTMSRDAADTFTYYADDRHSRKVCTTGDNDET